MGMIAESAGGFCCAGRDGKIYFKVIGQDSEEIPLKIFKTYKFGEEYKISRIAYEDGIRSFKYGDKTRNTLWINQDNIFVVDEDQIEKIYNEVKDLTINSFEGTSIINPAWDMGDKIIIDGKPIIYQGEMSLNGRFIADIKSKISIKQKQETTVKKESQSAINRKVQSQIDQTEGKITLLAEETNIIIDEKLNEYDTTIKSIIEQSAGSILASVSGTYATKTELSDTEENIEASLELKVDTEKLISEINASADQIRLKADRFFVDANINGIYDYNYYDTRNALCVYFNTLTETSLMRSLYDLDNNGSINLIDVQRMALIINGSMQNSKILNGTFEIRTNDVKNCLVIKNGSEIAVSLGIGGVNAQLVSAENIICGTGTVTSNINGVVINGTSSSVYFISDGNIGTVITPSSISTSEISATTISASSEITVANGRVMYGLTSNHKYQCNWTDAQLDFYVDSINVGTLSDKRLKTDIKEIDEDFIKAIEEVEMKQFKIANRNGLVSFGILAQDLVEIFEKYNKNPFEYEIVRKTQYRTDDDTVYYAINYEQYLILKAKAQEQKIQSLIKRIEILEGVR